MVTGGAGLRVQVRRRLLGEQNLSLSHKVADFGGKGAAVAGLEPEHFARPRDLHRSPSARFEARRVEVADFGEAGVSGRPSEFSYRLLRVRSRR